LAEFLPVEPTESHQTVRKRTLTLAPAWKTNRFGKSGRIRHWHASANNSARTQREPEVSAEASRGHFPENCAVPAGIPPRAYLSANF
jgi:hypothetical protein